MKPDFSTNKTIIEVHDDCEVDLSHPDLIGSVLGFNKKILQKGIHVSDNIVNIMDINYISICCDIVEGCYNKGETSDIIHTFIPDVPPGTKFLLFY